ncbi:MAG: RagB/SusD family nutrient uptake outer membrane protein [Prevotella sp.]|nr:RagB/SusD family nutrient uptake outer membrane protein [Prevotella sp.]
MKYNKISILAIAGALTLSACDDVNKQDPEGGMITQGQLTETYTAVPTRVDATFAGMFNMMGEPYGVFGTGRGRADDFGFVMAALSQDAEGADYIYPNSGYNWFSVCGEYTSRTPNYANPYIRYAIVYNQIKIANDLISSLGEFEDASNKNKVAQAKAIRAFDYLNLVPYFQFNYQGHQNDPCVPIVTPDTPDPANNPRASVQECYDLIMSDLNDAISVLGTARENKARININVAYGIRARANLYMGKWADAAADAAKAMEGYEPASIEEVSTPSFVNADDHNWIWGIILTDDQAQDHYATSASWLSSFSASAYTAGAACYAMINSMLYDKIPATDVRKGWWVDANLHSPLLSTISWDGVTGDDISPLLIEDVKESFTPYTNVKFGMKRGIGNTMNSNDFPLMRVEEMILIQAEGLAKSGSEDQARQILENFVKTYRDPEYSSTAQNRSLADEIWYQRRIELWGEGFFMADANRLHKPVVRFHDDTNNVPDAFRFNIDPDDPWLLMRFSDSETNANAAIVNNTGGTQPKQDQNPGLRDGVTD